MSRDFLSRVEKINAAARSIMKGDLSRGCRFAGTGDELDRLSGNLNDMLAQIERLMDGMREVSSNVAHDLKTPLTRIRACAEDALRSQRAGSAHATRWSASSPTPTGCSPPSTRCSPSPAPKPGRRARHRAGSR